MKESSVAMSDESRRESSFASVALQRLKEFPIHDESVSLRQDQQQQVDT